MAHHLLFLSTDFSFPQSTFSSAPPHTTLQSRLALQQGNTAETEQGKSNVSQTSASILNKIPP
jgi:hypothetical protein